MTPFTVRPYAPEDRDGVRHVCCETGFMGEPVDRLFTDRQLFADFFTRYYTDYEPENCVVAEAEGKIMGYLIGCCRYRLYPWAQSLIVLRSIPKALCRIVAGKYGRQNIRFLKWFTCRSWAETPKSPRNSAHFHVNILPDWRHGYVGRRLILPFVRRLPKRGVKRVYGQIQTYDDRRSPKVFERFGFKEFDRRKVSKFETFGKKGVYVSTLVREFD